MKKLLVIALVLATLPLFGQGTSVEWSAVIDPTYVMMTPVDTDTSGGVVDPEEIGDSYFQEVNSCVNAKLTCDGGITGLVKLGIVDRSNGVDTSGSVGIDEIWAAKEGAFGQDALSFKFGQFDIPFNLNVDNGVTHAFTYGTALASTGIGAINDTWGFCVGYKVDGVGQFYLTTYEGLAGASIADEADEDTGLFTSLALNWDTGADAFGVPGLRLVVGYGMRASEEDLDNGSCISVGGTYTIPGLPLVVSLEIDSSTSIADGGGFYIDEEGAMLMALGADYTVNDQFSVGLKYESIAYNEIADAFGPGADMDANTDSRIALYGSYILAPNSQIRFEYASVTNDYEATDWDTDGDDDELGYSTIAIGFKANV